METELRARVTMADEFVDDLVPPPLDWQRLVREHPLPALAIAALGGYWLGRHHGKEVLSAVSAFAATAVSEQVNELLGDEVL
jgi:hypothetical protein